MLRAAMGGLPDSSLPDNFTLRHLGVQPRLTAEDQPDIDPIEVVFGERPIEGVLFQHSTGIKTWKKRFVRLKASLLQVFDKEGASKARSVVDAAEFFVKPEVQGKFSRDSVFTLATTSEQHTFAASTDIVRDAWVAAIARVSRNSAFDRSPRGTGGLGAGTLGSLPGASRSLSALPVEASSSGVSPQAPSSPAGESVCSPAASPRTQGATTGDSSNDGDGVASGEAASGEVELANAELEAVVRRLISLTSSEAAYIGNLNAMIEVWFKPLKATPFPIVTPEQFQIMLSCVDVIANKSSKLVAALEAAAADAGLPTDAGAEISSDREQQEAYVKAALGLWEEYASASGPQSLIVLYSKYCIDHIPVLSGSVLRNPEINCPGLQ